IASTHAEELALLDRRLDVWAVQTIRYDTRRRSQSTRFAPPLEGEGRAVMAEQLHVQLPKERVCLEARNVVDLAQRPYLAAIGGIGGLDSGLHCGSASETVEHERCGCRDNAGQDRESNPRGLRGGRIDAAVRLAPGDIGKIRRADPQLAEMAIRQGGEFAQGTAIFPLQPNRSAGRHTDPPRTRALVELSPIEKVPILLNLL